MTDFLLVPQLNDMATAQTISSDRFSFGSSYDPRDMPLYSINEAARYLRLPPSTLRSWVSGRDYHTKEGRARFTRLINLPESKDPRLSFNNLIEAHVLKALRSKHGVQIKAIRAALEYAEKTLSISRLLIQEELKASGGDLFWDRYGKLINLSKSGQLVMRGVMESYLERIDRDTSALPIRLYPFVRPDKDVKTIVIDPYVSFGRPVIAGKGISTQVIAQRIEAGESMDELVEDYGLNKKEITDAYIYELAA